MDHTPYFDNVTHRQITPAYDRPIHTLPEKDVNNVFMTKTQMLTVLLVRLSSSEQRPDRITPSVHMRPRNEREHCYTEHIACFGVR